MSKEVSLFQKDPKLIMVLQMRSDSLLHREEEVQTVKPLQQRLLLLQVSVMLSCPWHIFFPMHQHMNMQVILEQQSVFSETPCQQVRSHTLHSLPSLILCETLLHRTEHDSAEHRDTPCIWIHGILLQPFYKRYRYLELPQESCSNLQQKLKLIGYN